MLKKLAVAFVMFSVHLLVGCHGSSTGASASQSVNIGGLIGKNFEEVKAELGNPEYVNEHFNAGEGDVTVANWTTEGQVKVTVIFDAKKKTPYRMSLVLPEGSNLSKEKLLEMARLTENEPRYTIELHSRQAGTYAGVIVEAK